MELYEWNLGPDSGYLQYIIFLGEEFGFGVEYYTGDFKTAERFSRESTHGRAWKEVSFETL